MSLQIGYYINEILLLRAVHGGGCGNRLGACALAHMVVLASSCWPTIQAVLLAEITQQNVMNFVWKSIMCEFMVPMVLVFDNG